MSIQGLLGRKIGMTTIYNDQGAAEAVTAIEVGPCVVTQVKTQARDGYEAIQVGFRRAKRLNKPLSGHMSRSGGRYKQLREFKVSDLSEYDVGQTLDASVFEAGEKIQVSGRSKGRGFAGGVRRYNFAGGPKTHGQSDRHRAPGAAGGGTEPGKVWKGARMAGHMGNASVTTRGLRVVRVDPEKNVVFVRGSVPGARNGIVRIERTSGSF